MRSPNSNSTSSNRPRRLSPSASSAFAGTPQSFASTKHKMDGKRNHVVPTETDVARMQRNRKLTQLRKEILTEFLREVRRNPGMHGEIGSDQWLDAAIAKLVDRGKRTGDVTKYEVAYWMETAPTLSELYKKVMPKRREPQISVPLGGRGMINNPPAKSLSVVKTEVETVDHETGEMLENGQGNAHLLVEGVQVKADVPVNVGMEENGFVQESGNLQQENNLPIASGNVKPTIHLCESHTFRIQVPASRWPMTYIIKPTAYAVGFYPTESVAPNGPLQYQGPEVYVPSEQVSWVNVNVDTSEQPLIDLTENGHVNDDMQVENEGEVGGNTEDIPLIPLSQIKQERYYM